MSTEDEAGFQVVVSRKKKKVTWRSQPPPRQNNRITDKDITEVHELILSSPGATISRIRNTLDGYYEGDAIGAPLTMQDIGDIVYDYLLAKNLVRCTDEKPRKWYPTK
jgi:hypothetical protein